MTKARWAGLLALILSALLLHMALALPNRVSHLVPTRPLALHQELPVLLALLLAAGGWPGLSRVLRILLAGSLTLSIVLKLADMAAFEAFSRPFNPVIDMFMFPASMNLLTGSLGRPLALALACGTVVALVLLAVILERAMARWSALQLPAVARAAAAVVALAGAALVAAEAGRGLGAWRLPVDPPGRATTTFLAAQQTLRARTSARRLAEYRKEAATDPYSGATGLFDRLDGRDVLIVFIESYGRSSFDNPLYRDTHVPTLRRAEGALRDAGLAVQSGWLTSPIAGGQSWLAHGTLASGLRTGDQARYGAMLASERQTLFHLARNAGYRTAAVMPAITLPWPEGPLLGFETILAAADLEYRGQPFNWVTMPDQYTLSAYPDLLGEDPRPDFLQIALISSHAPWVPVPRMVEWSEVGDGRIFDRWATSGDPPKVVWRDRDRVRDQYRQAIDYALQAAFSFSARQGGTDGTDTPLILVLGDHQPAPFVAQIDSRDVPLHVIAPPEVMDRIAPWGLAPGLVPTAQAPVWPMEDFRDRFIAAFSSRLGT